MKDDIQSGILEYPKFLKAFSVASKSNVDGMDDYILVKIRINIMHISSYLEAPELTIDGTTYQITAMNVGGIVRWVTLPIDAIDKMIENTEIKFTDTSNQSIK